MPKQPSKTRQTQGQQPEPAQIKAVERLIGTRDFPKASERARALVERFPKHSAANRLLVDAFFQAGNGPAAALAAYQWAQRRPNSLTAQRALFQLALEGEHLVLAYRTALRLGELDPNAAGHPCPPRAWRRCCCNPTDRKRSRRTWSGSTSASCI